MSAVDPNPNASNIVASSKVASSSSVSQPNVPLGLRPPSFTQEANRQIQSALLVTLGLFLTVVRITIIFIIAILADALIVAVISWSFGNMIDHYHFAALILEGIQLLSALGTAAAYIFYLISSLIKDVKRVAEEVKTKGNEEGK